ncbi:hypothetical protein [Sciscionella marina]|uniref:hypothetical protein n=1 Tax=Sciscionella marina TaxID=508770 RepID=UPI00036F24B6|nr:hypothetical protein [Sciscionella marina]
MPRSPTPGVRAVFATRGGKDAYRVTDLLETGALQDDREHRRRPLLGGIRTRYGPGSVRWTGH